MTLILNPFCDHFECSVLKGTETAVTSSVTIDWIMTNTTAVKPRRIQQTVFSQLEDLNPRFQ